MQQDAFHDEVLRRLDRLTDWMEKHDDYCRKRDERLTRVEERQRQQQWWGGILAAGAYVLSMLGLGTSQGWPPGGKP